MAAQTWTVIDVDDAQYLETDTEPAIFGSQQFGVRKSSKRGGLCDGVDVLDVVNDDFGFRLLPTRGMGLWDATLDGERYGWQSPVRGPVHPKYVDLSDPSGLGWLDGFDELLVRCGLGSNGAPEFDEQGRLAYPLHGRIANKPAHRVLVTVDDDTLTIVGEVEETRFHFWKLRMTTTITTKRGEPRLRIQDQIQNLSRSPAEMQLLYHVNLGLPLLDSGSKVVVPAKTIVPRNNRAAEGIANWDSFQAPQPGFEEQVYFLHLHANDAGETHTLLKNAHGTRGVSLRFNHAQLPCFTIWKNTTAVPDGYVTGIEPGTNFPNPRSYEAQQQRVVPLEPAGSRSFGLTLDLHGTAGEVGSAEESIAELQDGRTPTIHEQPQPGWCA